MYCDTLNGKINSRQEGVNSVLNDKALADAFNQENALVVAFSVIAKTDGLFAALY